MVILKNRRNQLKKILINVHYLPYWKIYINNSLYNPTLFDKLGRPIIKLDKPSTITVKYEQTNVEKVGNAISIIALLGLITIVTLLHGFTCLPAGRLLKTTIEQ